SVSKAGARSSPTPAPACSFHFRALIAAEWYHGVRIRRCDRLVGALFTRTPARFSRNVLSYTAGLSKEGFVADSRTYDATLRNLEIIDDDTTWSIIRDDVPESLEAFEAMRRGNAQQLPERLPGMAVQRLG
ncbi:MAG: hypothetical protein ACNA8G_06155, partial [Gammaproteobacteria bacterium]